MHPLSKPWPFGLGRRTAIWFIVGFVAVIAALYPVDRPLTVLAEGLPSDVRAFFRWMTRWGESDWILIPSLAGVVLAWLVSLVTRDRLRLWARHLLALSGFIFLGVGLPSLVATLLKRLIGRGRPIAWTTEAPLSFTPLNWDVYTHQSFPSGHTTTAFSLALTIAFLWPRSLWPMLVFAVLVGASRVVLGQHHLTDVAGAAVLGTLGAYAVRGLFASRGWLFDKAADGAIVRRPFASIR